MFAIEMGKNKKKKKENKVFRWKIKMIFVVKKLYLRKKRNV